jgi:hypothetical protein
MIIKYLPDVFLAIHQGIIYEKHESMSLFLPNQFTLKVYKELNIFY